MNARIILIRVSIALALAPVVLILVIKSIIYFSGRTNDTVVSSGELRTYLVHVPENYDLNTPMPLVVSLHGLALWPSAHQKISQWDRVAEQFGFIVVYPSGLGFLPAWRVDPGPELSADIRFISDLIDELSENYNIDSSRIYVNGFSNGGGFVFALSCALSEKIAAIGTVAGAQTLPWTWCQNPDPIPAIAFHGTADRMVPYSGGPSGDPIRPREFPAVADWTNNWARRNQCGPDAETTSISEDVVQLEYVDCKSNSTVMLYTVDGGGHTWPGGNPIPEWIAGRTTENIDASMLMWEFFRRYRNDQE